MLVIAFTMVGVIMKMIKLHYGIDYLEGKNI